MPLEIHLETPHRTLQMTFETLTDLWSYSCHIKHSQNVTVVIQNSHRSLHLQSSFRTLTERYSRLLKHSQNFTVAIQNSHRTSQSSLNTLTEVYRRHSRHSRNFTVATPKHSQLQWTPKTNAKAICLTCNTQEKHIIQHKARTFFLINCLLNAKINTKSDKRPLHT